MGISREQALDCLRSDDLIGIGMEADAVRRRLHPEGVVSYGVEAEIACAGFAVEAVCEKLSAAAEMGASGVVLRGPSTEMVAEVRRRFPEMWLVGVLEVGHEALTAMRAAGMDSLVSESLELHRAAHTLGMTTVATFVFGAGETLEQRLDELEAVRALQAQTGGFAAVVPVSFHAVGGRELDETTAVEYLKMVAVTRMFLDNVEHVQTEWRTQGLKVLQMGLRFGANDVGAVRIGEAGKASEEELRRVIRDAGFAPVERGMGYRLMMLGV